jgi:CRISPR system Cascade subunit CasA
MALLWLYDWNGESGLGFDKLEPYYIEICRRIRFTEKNSILIMNKKSTKNCRITGAKQQNGNVGDPWIPIEKTQERKALTIGKSGYRYDKLCDILFSGNYTKNICSTLYSEDRNVLLCSAITRGQAKTEGLHERVLPIPKSTKNFLSERNDMISLISKKWIDDTSTAKRRLKSVLLSLLQGAPQTLKWQDKRAEKWLLEYTDRVDRIFFRVLWEVLEGERVSVHEVDSDLIIKAQCKWRKHLISIIEDIFKEAKRAMPIPTAMRYRAISKNANQLRGFLFSFLKETCDDNQTTGGNPESIQK